MQGIDLNLLTALDVLLAEESVTRAAKRLALSPSAMSRTLARLRAVTGDPLLVRAGRRLAPSPRALEMRERVRALVHDAQAVLSPAGRAFDPFQLERVFTIRANEGFVDLFAAALVTGFARRAPGVRLRFAAKPEKDPSALREGQVDLEVGVPGNFAPEVRARTVLRDRFIGVVRDGHPMLGHTITPRVYAQCDHVVASRKGVWAGPVDTALKQLGLKRTVRVVVPSFADALTIARDSDLVALVPGLSLRAERDAGRGLTGFSLPFETPRIIASALWHPRMQADPAHVWFRETTLGICRDTLEQVRAGEA